MSPRALAVLLAAVPDLVKAVREAGSESKAEAVARRRLIDASYEIARHEKAARDHQ